MIPHEQFICDYCKEVISCKSDGTLEFLSSRDANGEKHCSEFKIIHHPSKSPLADLDDYKWCFHHKSGESAHLDLNWHFSVEIEETLKGNFRNEYGVSEELKEIEKRLTIPFYEEARQFFDKALKDGFVDPGMLAYQSSGLLETIILKYKKE